jgi:hypothetical protein
MPSRPHPELRSANFEVCVSLRTMCRLQRTERRTEGDGSSATISKERAASLLSRSAWRPRISRSAGGGVSVVSESHAIVVMPVFSSQPTNTCSVVSALLEKHDVKLVRVLRNHRIVGIISHANLPRAVVSLWSEETFQRADDEQIVRGHLLEELGRRSDGVAIHECHSQGEYRLVFGPWSKGTDNATRSASAENTSGVLKVSSHVAVAPNIHGNSSGLGTSGRAPNRSGVGPWSRSVNHRLINSCEGEQYEF